MLQIVGPLRRGVVLLGVKAEVVCVPAQEAGAQALSQLLQGRHCLIEHQEVAPACGFQHRQAKGLGKRRTEEQIGEPEQFQYRLSGEAIREAQIRGEQQIPVCQAGLFPSVRIMDL